MKLKTKEILIFFLITLLLNNLLLPYSILAAEKVEIGVFNLSSKGVDKTLVDNLSDFLSAEIKKIVGYSVISQEDIKNMLDLEAQKMWMGCEDDVSCISEIVGAFGFEYLVTGSIGKIGTIYNISLQLLNVKIASVKNRISRPCPCTVEQLIVALKIAVHELFEKDVPRGLKLKDTSCKLNLKANVPGARVYVDENFVGSTPLYNLRIQPGRHSLKLTKNGYATLLKRIKVSEQTSLSLKADMIPLRESRKGVKGDFKIVSYKYLKKKAPWYKKWWVWTIIGGVAVGGAVTAASLMGNGDDKGSDSAPVTINIPALEEP